MKDCSCYKGVCRCVDGQQSPTGPGSFVPERIIETSSKKGECACVCNDVGARRRSLLAIGSTPTITLASMLPGRDDVAPASPPSVLALGGAGRRLLGKCDCTQCPSPSPPPPPPAEPEHVPVPCPPGKTGPDDGPCAECAAGSFKANPGTALCEACEAGKFAAATASTECVDCAAASESESGASTCKCSAGSTGPDGGDCSSCVAGKFKSIVGSAGCSDCGQGKFSEAVGAASSATCTECPANSDAPTASTSQTSCICNAGSTGPDGGPCSLCQAGTYKVVAGSGACAVCDAGTYSADVGATSEQTCVLCPANSESPPGSVAATSCLCNAGSSGPDGGTCAVCAAGKYKSAAGSAACIDCGAGTYSTTSGAVSEGTCQACPANSVSTAGSGLLADCVCVAGTSGPDGGACTACEAGKFKEAAGSSECSECNAGTYSTAIGALSEDTCEACPANSNSAAGSTECVCDAGFTGTAGQCSACSPGKFKSDVGDGPCQDCGPGEFSTQAGAIICHDCPADSHAEAGASECVCNAGYTGAHESCSACAAGTFKSASGSGDCVDCAAGTFSANSAAVVCEACAGDASSAAGSTACECNAGFSGPADSCTACATGTYKSAAGSDACSDCEAGKFSASTASQACEDCPSNSDSSPGSDSCECNAGFSGPNSGGQRRLLGGVCVCVCVCVRARARARVRACVRVDLRICVQKREVTCFGRQAHAMVQRCLRTRARVRTHTHRGFVCCVCYRKVQGSVWVRCVRGMCSWQVCRQHGFCPVPRLWCERGFCCRKRGLLLRSGVHGRRLFMRCMWGGHIQGRFWISGMCRLPSWNLPSVVGRYRLRRLCRRLTILRRQLRVHMQCRLHWQRRFMCRVCGRQVQSSCRSRRVQRLCGWQILLIAGVAGLRRYVWCSFLLGGRMDLEGVTGLLWICLQIGYVICFYLIADLS